MKRGKIDITPSHTCKSYTKQWVTGKPKATDNDSSISSKLSSKLSLPTHIAPWVMVINKPNRETKSLSPDLISKKQLCSKGKELFPSYYIPPDVKLMITLITTAIDKDSTASVSNNTCVHNKANMV